MKHVIKMLLTLNVLLYLFCFSSCNENNNANCFKTKEDSIAFAKKVAKLYPEVCLSEETRKASLLLRDTIKLPENLENIKFTDGYFYRYFKTGNLLISEKLTNQNGFNIMAGKDAPIPLSSANDCIRIFRRDMGLTDLDHKLFALSFRKSEIDQLYNNVNCNGFRLYFGRYTSNGDISIFLCGYKNDSNNNPGEDMYFNGKLPDGTIGDYVVDDMSKCPTMCPRTITTKKMLGLFIGTPTIGAETDRVNP